MKRILVVDDEGAIRGFLKRGLQYKGFDVLEASTGAEALRQLRLGSPDLVLLDVVLPDANGFDLCRSIREDGYVVLPIILLTARDEVSDKIAGLDEGADDYITKPFDFAELLAHIRAALRRIEGVPHLAVHIQVGDLLLDRKSRRVWRGNRQIDLTKKEYDLLELLAQNAGQVLTKERIFERVWGYDNDAGLEVIKVYINYLRAKLNAGGKADLIQAVRGVGYTLKAGELSQEWRLRELADANAREYVECEA
jgi:two-component system response regulator MprA